MANYMCKDLDCYNNKVYKKQIRCPECDKLMDEVGFMERGKVLNDKKAKTKSKTDKEIENDKQLILEKKNKIHKEYQKSLVWNPDNQGSDAPIPLNSLFDPNMIEGEILDDIYKDMTLQVKYGSEGKWMLAVNAQNNIIIRQNELILRELKRLNSKNNVNE